MADEQLQLLYDFLPTPNPIRASQAGANPRAVDLQVMASYPGGGSVTLRQLSITIPVGADAAGTLSNAAALPQPYAGGAFPWTLTVTGGTVTLQPQKGASGTISGTLLFTIPGIVVNETPGLVRITVTEFPAGGGKVTDTTSYVLVKQPADFEVTRFWAQPAVLDDLDQHVTLYWACSDPAAGYLFSVHSDSWQPRDCLQAGSCYSCADGAAGVPVVPALTGTTTFSLDVIRADPAGHRTLQATLRLTVPAVVPSISQLSFLVRYVSGRVVRLHWLARNAARCTVQVDGATLDDQAPTDTYDDGYLVVLPARPEPYQPTVVAHAATGSARATFIFPQVAVRGASGPIRLATPPQVVAVTPDGTRGVLVSSLDLMIMDVATQAVTTVAVFWGIIEAAAVTPDGRFALVASQKPGEVFFVDLAAPAAPTAVQVGSGVYGMGLSADGTRAFATTLAGRLWTLDVASRSVTGSIAVEFPAAKLAVAGTSVVVATPPAGSLQVVDPSTGTIREVAVGTGVGLSLGAAPGTVLAATAGAVALVDLDALQVVSTLELPSVTDITVSQAGSFALLLQMSFVDNSTTVTVVDLVTRRVAGTFREKQRIRALALAADGLHGVAALDHSAAVVL